MKIDSKVYCITSSTCNRIQTFWHVYIYDFSMIINADRISLSLGPLVLPAGVANARTNPSTADSDTPLRLSRVRAVREDLHPIKNIKLRLCGCHTYFLANTC